MAWRRASRVRHPGAQVVVNLHLKVAFDLRGELLLAAARSAPCRRAFGSARTQASSCGIVRRREEARQDGRRLLPVARFTLQLPAARAGEFVKLRLAIVFRDAPL